MFHRFSAVAPAVCGALAFIAVAAQPPALSTDSFDHYTNVLRPDDQDLRYLEIPWRSTFAEGVEEAYKHRKPVLLWAMNGHPLGCT